MPNPPALDGPKRNADLITQFPIRNTACANVRNDLKERFAAIFILAIQIRHWTDFFRHRRELFLSCPLTIAQNGRFSQVVQTL